MVAAADYRGLRKVHKKKEKTWSVQIPHAQSRAGDVRSGLAAAAAAAAAAAVATK